MTKPTPPCPGGNGGYEALLVPHVRSLADTKLSEENPPSTTPAAALSHPPNPPVRCPLEPEGRIVPPPRIFPIDPADLFPHARFRTFTSSLSRNITPSASGVYGSMVDVVRLPQGHRQQVTSLIKVLGGHRHLAADSVAGATSPRKCRIRRVRLPSSFGPRMFGQKCGHRILDTPIRPPPPYHVWDLQHHN